VELSKQVIETVAKIRMALKADVARLCQTAQRYCNDANTDVTDQDECRSRDDLDEIDERTNDDVHGQPSSATRRFWRD
jgi:hypothetical protein